MYGQNLPVHYTRFKHQEKFYTKTTEHWKRPPTAGFGTGDFGKLEKCLSAVIGVYMALHCFGGGEGV